MLIRRFLFSPTNRRHRRIQVSISFVAVASGIATLALGGSGLLTTALAGCLLLASLLAPSRHDPKALQAARDLKLLPPAETE